MAGLYFATNEVITEYITVLPNNILADQFDYSVKAIG